MTTHPTLRTRGFTLIELMVTLAIVAILMMVAVPSFVAFQRNAELTSASNTMLAALNAARSEAMKRNQNVMVTPLGTGWASGWQVFVDVDRSGTLSTGDIVITTYPALQTYFTVSGTGNANLSSPYVLFNGSGYASDTGGTLGNLTIEIARSDLSGSELLEQTRRVKVANTGRVRVCKATDTTNCVAGGS